MGKEKGEKMNEKAMYISAFIWLAIAITNIRRVVKISNNVERLEKEFKEQKGE